jgi:hypothetical protein
MRTRRKYFFAGVFLLAFCIWTIFTTSKLLEYPPSVSVSTSSEDHTTRKGSKTKSNRRSRRTSDDDTRKDEHEHEDQGTKDKDDILHELDILSGGYQYTKGTKGKDIGIDKEGLKCPPPLVPFHNRIVQNDGDDMHIINNIHYNDNANSTNSTNKVSFSKIPRIMHVTMKSRCLPRDLAATMDRWKEKLPYHSIFLHDDEAVSKLIDQEWPEFPDLHKAMKCVLYKGAMKIDVWRVLMLFRYGGLYSDMDNWPLDPFTEAKIMTSGGVNDDMDDDPLSAFFFHDPFNRPSQWFMSIEPSHPIMYLAMKKIIHNLLKMDNMHRPQVVFVTGPAAVGVAYHHFLAPVNKDKDDVFQNDVVLTGIFEKKVLKTSSKGFISIKEGYDEIVSYNATLNVTREERIAMDAGMPHWTHLRGSHVKYLEDLIPKTCQGYLEAIANGSIAEVPTITK